ncbi:hypothetical protein N7478_005686 [Penicillium angulare]|uniref:uncharacterized protein n=1 Tax=Penicillium angulare TaxID=116970 RepID=UPI0025405A99|nr:uncharacterized protein N7478_005686 [Penicillium angulare]KAJ5280314.1 hypothetical protein N7478_005686 [Penicillium angulare]
MPSDRHSTDQRANSDRNQASEMPRNNDWENDTNPFVAFRRFADEQVSSVLQSITGLPSSINPPQSDNWTIFTDDRGYKNMAFRHRTGTNNAVERESNQNADNSTPGDRTDPSNNNNDQKTARPWQQSSIPPEDAGRTSQPPSRNSRYDEQRPSDFFGLDSFFQNLEHHFLPFASSFFHPHHNFFLSDMFSDDNSSTWPFSYIMLSPYSPLHLERQAQYRAVGEGGVFSSIMSSLKFDSEPESARDPTEPRWREAFEDLIRLENGKPLLDRNSTPFAQIRENGSEWIHGLVKRGSLGEQWKYVSGTDNNPWTGIIFTGHSQDGHEVPETEKRSLEQAPAIRDEKEAESELEMYERFLQDIEARELEFSREIASSPLLRALLEERQRRRDVFEKFESGFFSEDEYSKDDTESWLDLVSGGNRKSVPETEEPVTSTPTAAVEGKPVESEFGNVTARVISTMIRTERTRLPDGSIQVKKVQTKRFEDGREETESSEETSHSSRNGEAQSGENESKPKTGWFWKD